MVSLLVLSLTSAAPQVADFDAFLTSEVRRPLEARRTPAQREVLQRAFASAEEPRLGVPTVLWVPPRPEGARSLKAMGVSPEEAARRALFTWAPAWRWEPGALAEAPLLELHDTGTGALIARFRRVVDGHPVLRDTLCVVLNRELDAVALTGHLSPYAPVDGFRLTEETALLVALRDVTGAAAEEGSVPRIAVGSAGWRFHGTAQGRFAEPPRVRKAWYGLPSALLPAFEVDASFVDADGTTQGYVHVVSAVDGAVLARVHLTQHAAHTYRVWAKASAPFTPLDGPQGDAATPYPTAGPSPLGFTPVAPVLVTLDHAGLSTADAWLPSGALTLSGNNVTAYADLYPPDGFNEPDAGLPLGPDGGVLDGGFDDAGVPYRARRDLDVPLSAAGTFDFNYDFGRDPDATDEQRRAAAAHAFFVTNWLHDVFYGFGFGEAAGNAQQDNYGRGGVDGDGLKVEVSDYAGTNNANLLTPPDGRSPRMQLFRWQALDFAQVAITSPFNAALDSVPLGAAGRTWNTTGTVVVAANTTDGGDDGCGGLANAGALSNRVVLMSAGGCSPREKVDHAWDAGAAGVVLARLSGGVLPGVPLHPLAPPTHLVADPTEAQVLFDAMDGGSASVVLQRAPRTARTAALDSSLIAHEWGHLLSNRLVGDGLGLMTTAGRGLGEGWSDFVALWVGLASADAQVPSNANWSGAFAVAQWSSTDLTALGAPSEDAWFGPRRLAYSVDRAKNDLTYRHVGLNVPLPLTAPTRPNGLPSPQAHNAGEVWCTALWEAQVALLRDSPRLSFDDARNRMMQYVVAGLKATPVFPTFLEARDAVLAVALASSGPDYQTVLAAFASRGFGLGALAPDRKSATLTPLAEDFSTTGGYLKVLSVTFLDDGVPCDADGSIDFAETGHARVRLMNVGAVPIDGATVTLTANGLTFIPASVALPRVTPFTTTEVTVEVTPRGLASTIYITDLSVRASGGGLSAPQTFTQRLRLNVDTVASTIETFERVELEDPTSGWEQDWNGGHQFVDGFQRVAVSASNSIAQATAPDVSGDSVLVSPPLKAGSAPVSFTFSHAYSFEFNPTAGEYFDGAVLEVSGDRETWTAIPGSALSTGYDGVLLAGTDNPLAGREAFRGAQAAFTPVTVSLGTAFANQTFWVRFRLGTDASGPGAGWRLDDVAFTGLVNQPFAQQVVHRGLCLNRAPTVSGTRSFSMNEREQVLLEPGVTADADGDPLTLTWTQESGPRTVLAGAVLTAPEVTQTEQLGLKLTVSDGRGGEASERITVTVRDVNRLPVVTAGPPQEVEWGTTVTLSATATDADGEVPRFLWRQLDGPQVTLSDERIAQPTFVAPQVEANTQLTFEVVALDALSASAPAPQAIFVTPKKGGCGCQGPTGAPLAFLGLLLAGLKRRRRRDCRP